MTTIGNKHVARVGHEFAAAMTADTPIIEIAKMVSRLASALDKQTELAEQLAVENASLLTPENWLKHSEEGAAASAIAEGNGASEDEALLAGMKAIIACMQSPATDGILAALRAEAITAALDNCSEYCEGDCVMDSNGIGYEDAQLRAQGAVALNEALLRAARRLPESKVLAQVPTPLSAAITDIIAERQRQQSVEGWTPEHDDEHRTGALARAAVCYASHAGNPHNKNMVDYQKTFSPARWPWSQDWWKPTNPRRDLVKAGALIAAEIERLDRAAGGEVQS